MQELPLPQCEQILHTLSMFALRLAALRLHWKMMPPHTVPTPMKITRPVNMIYTSTPYTYPQCEESVSDVAKGWLQLRQAAGAHLQ
jgi:hypothetical protein